MASPNPSRVLERRTSNAQEPKIVLGSSSKWRKQILSDMGYSFTTMSPDIDERAIKCARLIYFSSMELRISDPDPKMTALLIARAKSVALASKISEPAIVITSDQIIICNNEVRNKPTTEDECRAFLRTYSTHPAECINAVVVLNTATKKSVEGIDVAKQYFKAIPDDFITALIAQGDVMYCGGGFAIELMDPYLDHREGEAESVIGLPPTLTHRLIVEALGL